MNAHQSKYFIQNHYNNVIFVLFYYYLPILIVNYNAYLKSFYMNC